MRGLSRLFGRDRVEPVTAVDASDLTEVEATRACRHCGGQVSRGATVCIHCEQDLSPVMTQGQFVQLFGAPDSSSTGDRKGQSNSTDDD